MIVEGVWLGLGEELELPGSISISIYFSHSLSLLLHFSHLYVSTLFPQVSFLQISRNDHWYFPCFPLHSLTIREDQPLFSNSGSKTLKDSLWLWYLFHSAPGAWLSCIRITQCNHGVGTMIGCPSRITLLEREGQKRGQLLPENGWGAGQTKH